MSAVAGNFNSINEEEGGRERERRGEEREREREKERERERERKREKKTGKRNKNFQSLFNRNLLIIWNFFPYADISEF